MSSAPFRFVTSSRRSIAVFAIGSLPAVAALVFAIGALERGGSFVLAGVASFAVSIATFVGVAKLARRVGLVIEADDRAIRRIGRIDRADRVEVQWSHARVVHLECTGALGSTTWKLRVLGADGVRIDASFSEVAGHYADADAKHVLSILRREAAVSLSDREARLSDAGLAITPLRGTFESFTGSAKIAIAVLVSLGLLLVKIVVFDGVFEAAIPIGTMALACLGYLAYRWARVVELQLDGNELRGRRRWGDVFRIPRDRIAKVDRHGSQKMGTLGAVIICTDGSRRTLVNVRPRLVLDALLALP